MLKDELIFEARKRAADRKSNVSAIVNESLMIAFRSASHTETAELFQMPAFSHVSGQLVSTSPAEFDQLLVAGQMAHYQS